jgi:hypothetical protein
MYWYVSITVVIPLICGLEHVYTSVAHIEVVAVFETG